MDAATLIWRLKNSPIIRGVTFTDIFRIMSAVSLLISMNLPTALGIQAAEQNLSLTLVEKNEPVHWYFQRILVFLKIPGVNKPSVESKTCGNYTKKMFQILLYVTPCKYP